MQHAFIMLRMKQTGHLFGQLTLIEVHLVRRRFRKIESTGKGLDAPQVLGGDGGDRPRIHAAAQIAADGNVTYTLPLNRGFNEIVKLFHQCILGSR